MGQIDALQLVPGSLIQSDQSSFLAGSQGKKTVALQNPNPINDMPYNMFAIFEVALLNAQNDNQTSSTETCLRMPQCSIEQSMSPAVITIPIMNAS